MYCLIEWASLEGQCAVRAYPDKTRTHNIII